MPLGEMHGIRTRDRVLQEGERVEVGRPLPSHPRFKKTSPTRGRLKQARLWTQHLNTGIRAHPRLLLEYLCRQFRGRHIPIKRGNILNPGQSQLPRQQHQHQDLHQQTNLTAIRKKGLQ